MNYKVINNCTVLTEKGGKKVEAGEILKDLPASSMNQLLINNGSLVKDDTIDVEATPVTSKKKKKKNKK